MPDDAIAADATSANAPAGQIESAPLKYEFFVYIVESPSAADLFLGHSEGALVESALRLDRISCESRTAINRTAFEVALRFALPQAMKKAVDKFPILHISAHGSMEGIQLSSGEVITWSELRDLLIPINESLEGVLLLCMSACEGFGACQMAMQEDGAKHPYLAMIGSVLKPTWSDTAVSYLAFYHLLAKGRKIPDCIVAMNATTGAESWIVQSAQEIQQSYSDYLKRSSEPTEVQHKLEAVAQQGDPSPDAKALESGLAGLERAPSD